MRSGIRFMLTAGVLLCFIGLLPVRDVGIDAQQTLPLPGTRADTELLTNGGFETDSNGDKIPDGWVGKKVTTEKPDRKKCDKPEDNKFFAHSGSCAFVFQGNLNGTSSSLQQGIEDTSLLINGTNIVFSAYLDPRSAVPGTVFGKAQIKYNDLYGQKFKLRVPDGVTLMDNPRDVEDYVLVEDSQFVTMLGDVTNTTITGVKVKFVQAATSGKFLIDDASFRTTSLFRLIGSEDSSYFGDSIAISGDGSTVLIGADFEHIDANFGVGAAYIFTRSGDRWIQQAKLIADDGEVEDYFGGSVALSSDGNTALIGAYGAGSGENNFQGAAYIFTRSGDTWTQQKKLTASDGDTSDMFGSAVALSSDGSTALIGAYGHDVGANIQQGQVYIYSGVDWSEETPLVIPDGAVTDRFGRAIALSSDDSTLIISTIDVDSGQGAAYVFTGSGAAWTQQSKLIADDAIQDAYFGNAVALSSDGNTALVGDELRDTGSSDDQGAAYIFTRNGDTWTQQKKLTGNDQAVADYFGHSVALSSDGNTALVGAMYQTIASNHAQGAAYLFERASGVWIEPKQLLAPDGESDDNFGTTVALTDNGNTAFVGAGADDIDLNSDQGSAYVFDLTQP